MDEREEMAEVAKVAEMPDLAPCMQSVIEQLEKDKKRSAVHTYTYALKSFTNFCWGEGTPMLEGEGTPMPVDEVFTPGKLKEYEEWMKLEGRKNKDGEPKGLSLNTVSTYMRTLKAVYNRLVDKKVLERDAKLFDNVYTEVEAKTKRALTEEQTETLMSADFEKLPEEVQCALAYFLLMFLFRGMPYIDLAHLRKQDVKEGCIVYSRHKTGRQITVRIPKEAISLLEEFRNKNPNSIYLFPILDANDKKDKKGEKGKKDKAEGKKDQELYDRYQQALRSFNKQLEKLAALLLAGVKISSYTPRHTWATLAFYANVNIGIISRALGHSSIKVTETYLKPFENEKLDAANDELILSIRQSKESKKVA